MIRILIITFILLMNGLWGFCQGVDLRKKYGYLIESEVSSNRVFRTPLLIQCDISDQNLKDFGSKIEILRQLGDNTYIIQLVDGALPRGLISFRINNLWKLAEHLSADFDRTKDILIKSSRDLSEMDFVQVANRLYRARLTADQLTALLAHPDITYLGEESTQLITEARVLDLNLNPNKINLLHHTYPQYMGQGVTASIKENAYDVHDIDIRGRSVITGLEADLTDNHSTEMATIVGGAGNSFVWGRGVAKGVTLTSSDFQHIVPDADETYSSYDISVQNHSYGTQVENFYGAYAEAYDQSSVNNPTLLHVFSSGNRGLYTNESGTYEGIEGVANLTGNFKQAKNVVAVGAVDAIGETISFVSQGPAYDGRVKPEVVAYSTNGSSNSAALVSGTVAVLQQAYKEANGNLPPSALMKGLLITSAEDVANPGIDYETGYGQLNAKRAMDNLTNTRYYEGTINTGGSVTYQITVPDNVENLKITLTWLDPVAPIDATTALVNDLDIVVSAGGTTWLPWVLDSSPGALEDLPQRQEDHLNNVEMVTIADPTAGIYNVDINASALMTISQPFYITYQWDEQNVFQWENPTSSDNYPYDGETTTYLRWFSTLAQTTGQLEYSTDEGVNWSVIDNQVDLDKGYYLWTVPIINDEALVRMVVGADSYQTEYFSISAPIRPSIGFNCQDSVLIQWPNLDAALSYEVHSMGEQYLELMATTADTSLIINKSDYATRQFSVTPILDHTRAIQSYTFDYSSQGVGCYVVSFYSATMKEGINLSLQLGSAYQVESVAFERSSGNQDFYFVGQINTITDNQIEFLDLEPIQGYNEYQARIFFANGSEVVTDITSSYYLSSTPLIVFPNPIALGEYFSVYTKQVADQSGIIEIINRTGQVVSEQRFFSDQNFISTQGLKQGLYFYRVHLDGEFIGHGKLMIE